MIHNTQTPYRLQLDYQRGSESTLAAIPIDVAVCPECGHQLWAEATEHTEEGNPTTGGLYVDCMADHAGKHKHWQSDWQPVRDAIGQWCNAEDV